MRLVRSVWVISFQRNLLNLSPRYLHMSFMFSTKYALIILELNLQTGSVTFTNSSFSDSKLQCEGRVGLCKNIFLLKEKAHRVREVPRSNVCDC